MLLRGLGISRTLSAEAVAQLPADIGLALSPYAREPGDAEAAARADGHEIFVDLAVEPVGFPDNDSGPKALLAALPEEENRRRLDWSLDRYAEAAGAFMPGAGAFASSPEAAGPVAAALAARGYALLHGGAIGLGDASGAIAADATLDLGQGQDAFDRALRQAERTARSKGSALLVVVASPAAIRRLAPWLAGLEAEGFALAPPSSLAPLPPPS